MGAKEKVEVVYKSQRSFNSLFSPKPTDNRDTKDSEAKATQEKTENKDATKEVESNKSQGLFGLFPPKPADNRDTKDSEADVMQGDKENGGNELIKDNEYNRKSIINKTPDEGNERKKMWGLF